MSVSRSTSSTSSVPPSQRNGNFPQKVRNESQVQRLTEAVIVGADRFKRHTRSRKKVFAPIDFHGFGLIVEAETVYLRVFWTIVVVISIAMSIYMSFRIVQYMVTTKTISKFDHLPVRYSPPSNEVGYPTVTICDSTGRSFLNASKLEEDNVTDTMVHYVLVSGPLWELNYTDIPQRAVTDDPASRAYFQALVAKHGTEANALRAFLKKYSFTCPELLHSCRNANWQKIDCCEIFRSVIHLHHGVCFATDAERMRKLAPLKSSGIFSNVFFKLKTDIRTWRSQYRKQDSQWFEIYLDSVVEQGIWRTDSIHIEAGEWTTVKLDVQHVETEITNSADCVYEGTSDAELTCLNGYSFSNCMWERRFLKNPQFLEGLADECHLPIVELTRHGFDWSNDEREHEHEHGREHCWEKPSRACTPSEIRNHVYQFTNGNGSFNTLGIFQGIAYWINTLKIADLNAPQYRCDALCDRWEYTYTYDTPTLEFQDRSYAGFTLMFGEGQYSRIREVPALEWFEYMALIGGIWGLWAGVSITTLIQCGVFSFQFCCKTRFTDKRKKNTSPNEQSRTESEVAPPQYLGDISRFNFRPSDVRF